MLLGPYGRFAVVAGVAALHWPQIRCTIYGRRDKGGRRWPKESDKEGAGKFENGDVKSAVEGEIESAKLLRIVASAVWFAFMMRLGRGNID